MPCLFKSALLLLLLGSCASAKRVRWNQHANVSSGRIVSFERACSAFQEGDFELAKDLFSSLAANDTLAKDYDSFAFLAECYRRLGDVDGGRDVYVNAVQFMQELRIKQQLNQGIERAATSLVAWRDAYPSFPAELLEENGFVQYDEPPILQGGWKAFSESAEYPAEVGLPVLQGTVRLRMLINENGKTSEVKVMKSLYPSFDRTAIEAAKRAEFIPAKRRGRPIRSWLSFPVTFRLL